MNAIAAIILQNCVLYLQFILVDGCTLALLHTPSTYLLTLFPSLAGAHVSISFCTVHPALRLTIVLALTIAARMPSVMLVNCSNAPSVFF